MDESLKAGIRGLGSILRREDAIETLRSAGWNSDVPLTVALRTETMGDVLDRCNGADRTMVLVFNPTTKSYTVAGFTLLSSDEDARVGAIEIDARATVRSMSVASLEDHILGDPNAIAGMKITPGKKLHIAI